jgi:hypothetical protein
MEGDPGYEREKDGKENEGERLWKVVDLRERVHPQPPVNNPTTRFLATHINPTATIPERGLGFRLKTLSFNLDFNFTFTF